jgi:hypothetical protein
MQVEALEVLFVITVAQRMTLVQPPETTHMLFGHKHCELVKRNPAAQAMHIEGLVISTTIHPGSIVQPPTTPSSTTQPMHFVGLVQLTQLGIASEQGWHRVGALITSTML